jgi:hypothetical protein
MGIRVHSHGQPNRSHGNERARRPEEPTNMMRDLLGTVTSTGANSVKGGVCLVA